MLGQALSSGQLRTDEYNERTGAVLEARTRGDIAGLTKDIGKPDPAPLGPSKFRPMVIVLSAIIIVVAVVPGAMWLAAQPGNCSPSGQSEISCLPQPPAFTTLTGKDFKLGHSPASRYLGHSMVFSTTGVGSQTSPTFRLDGGVLTVDATQVGETAYFYLVPVGQSLDVSSAPAWEAPPAPDTGNAVTVIPPAGSYRLYVLADASTRWAVTLNEFWMPPPGVTEASPQTQANPGQTLVVVRGDGNTKSSVFTLPANTTDETADGSYQAVIGAVAPNDSSMYLVPVGGTPIGVDNLSPNPGVIGTFNIPGPGKYYLQVSSSGQWMFGIQYGTNQFTW